MKRFLVSLMVCMLIFSLALPSLANNLNDPGTVPIAKEREPLRILMQEQTLVEDYETNAYTKYLEDTLNIDIQFEFLPASKPGDKLAVMISSGQKLPDVINFPIPYNTIQKYADAGALRPLDDLIEKYGVNFKAVTNEYPELDLERLMRSPDGHTYALPFYAPSLSDETRFKIWINQKWLDNLGLAMPTTTEEFKEVLRAFKTQDPNQNGKPDEVALVGATGWSQDANVNLLNAFIYNDSVDRFTVTNGQLDLAYRQDAWRSGLKYIRDLISEGLYDPISLTQTSEQLKAMVNNEGDCIVGAFAFSSPKLVGASSPWVNDYEPMEPLKGPEGVQYAAYVKTMPLYYWYVTSDSENPELAFRVGDYMFDQEVMMVNRYGIEGQQWTRASQEETEKSGARLAFYQTAEQDIFSISQNVTWRGAGPHFFGSPIAANLAPSDARYQKGIELYMKHVPAAGQYITRLSYTQEELEQISEIRTTLKSYVNNATALFITGGLDLDKDWENYINELDAIGIDTFLSISQKAFERQ